ncbi:transcriptional antitermination factor AmiR, partial [Pseudomonas aeruginosa]
MSANSLLGSLRELQVLVLNPPGEVSDALVLQLIRIGCSVRQCWPPPEAFDVPVDV